MVLHRLFEDRFQSQKSLVYGCWVFTIKRDHLGPRLAAADHFEGVGLDPLDDGVGDGGGRLSREAELGSGVISTSSSVCWSRRGMRSAREHLRP